MNMMMMDCIGLKKRLDMSGEMTIPAQLEKITSEMCDKYCKFPDQAKDEDELFKNHCDKCPKQEPKWIPVSERLPEENGFYLATYDGEICGENEPFTGLAEYENGKWVDDEEDYQCVLAWMPLPEPYKAEMGNEE